MPEDNKKPQFEEKPTEGSDNVKPDPRLVNYVQEGLEENRIRKKLLVADKEQKKQD